MREYNFMGDQGGPFKGCDSVSLSAADQFVLTVGQFNEFRLSELTDHWPDSAEWNEVVQFHKQSHCSNGLSDGFTWSPFE